MAIETIISFDMDSTMIHTMLPEEGRKIWLERKGENFPHPIGWWGKEESLDTEVFYHPVNQWVLKKYEEHTSDDKSISFMATGRLEKLKHKVLEILQIHNLDKFESVNCNYMKCDTFKFKVRLFEEKIKQYPTAKEFIMYDDRQEHLVKFVEWGKLQKIKVTVIDVVNKKQLL